MALALASDVKVSPEIRELGLEPYVLELEVNGLTIVPPEVHGVTEDQIDRMVEILLARAEEIVGCPFDLEVGPTAEIQFPQTEQTLSRLAGDEPGQPSQFLIQQLGRLDRAFRDLAVNPAAVTLMRHMIGPKAARFSSHNSFVKWQGDFGYGPHLGLHADQTAVPLPWGRVAYTSNTNWCLTDYTLDGGALAYVPGSHRNGVRPVQPEATRKAVPAEGPKGSLIVFHGATWHGAFPRKTPGMRLSIANYYRHMMVTSQEDIQGTFPRELADDCDNPELFKELAGFGDAFPYAAQTQPLPRAVG